MNQSELEAILVVLDHLRYAGRHQMVDSSTQKQVEMDQVLATMLQEHEDRRAAVKLQKQEKGEIHGDLEGVWRKEKGEKQEKGEEKEK